MELTHRELCSRLEREIELDGSLTAAAAVFGVTPATLSLILHEKRGIGPKILKRLGLKKHVVRIVTYTEIPNSKVSKKLRESCLWRKM